MKLGLKDVLNNKVKTYNVFDDYQNEKDIKKVKNADI
jgi:hypothetical protein